MTKKLLLNAMLGFSILACRAPFLFSKSGQGFQASQKLAPRLIEVRADQAWNNTGIILREGDLLIIRYVSGVWSPWRGGAFDAIGSGGDPNCDCNVLKGVSHAALIGKVGEGMPFFIGEQFRLRLAEAGILYLGINDRRTTDNSGSLFVQVEVWR
jgi:hypothetical protein